jgi:hypothetical protein
VQGAGRPDGGDTFARRDQRGRGRDHRHPAALATGPPPPGRPAQALRPLPPILPPVSGPEPRSDPARGATTARNAPRAAPPVPAPQPRGAPVSDLAALPHPARHVGQDNSVVMPRAHSMRAPCAAMSPPPPHSVTTA